MESIQVLENNVVVREVLKQLLEFIFTFRIKKLPLSCFLSSNLVEKWSEMRRGP